MLRPRTVGASAIGSYKRGPQRQSLRTKGEGSKVPNYRVLTVLILEIVIMVLGIVGYLDPEGRAFQRI